VVVSRRVLSGLFSVALAVACVVAAPSATRAPGARWVAPDHAVAAPPGRGEVRVGRTGEGRLVPGLAAGPLLALLPVAAVLPPVQARASKAPAGEHSTFSRVVSAAWSARGPPRPAV
jgi:hypothetical protein